MGFLPFNRQIEEVDQHLCSDLWHLVQGEDRGGVSWDTLKVLFLNLVGLKTPERERDAPPQEENQNEVEGDRSADRPANDSAKLGFFEGNEFYLKRNGHAAFFGHFKNFYVHRIGYMG